MDNAAILDSEPSLPLIEPAVELTAAAKTTGRSLVRLGRDMLWTIRRSRGRLTMADYLYYRLWDDAFSSEAKLAFVGRGLEPVLHGITADVQWIAAFHDKLLNYFVLERAGFPVPDTVALYRGGGTLPGSRCLAGPEELGCFLRETGALPWFGKPVTGIRSAGTVRAEHYDPASDQVVLAGGKRVAADDLAGAISRYATDGYLFQKVLSPHADIARLTGGRLAGARLVVLLRRGCLPHLCAALLKLPVGGNIADNFWRPGNLIAAVDGDSGRIIRVVRGVGHRLCEVEAHPDTGLSLHGIRLPDWRQAVDLCLAASTLFPRIRMQAWDVALCAGGPVLMEANVGGDYNLPQLAHAKGMFTPEFGAFLVDCAADKGKPARRIVEKLGLAPP